MTDLVPIEQQKELAKMYAASDLLPKAYRGQPANVLVAVDLGRAVGLPPAIALQEIAVVDGKPSLSAKAQAALVRRAGHILRVTGDDTTAIAQLIRRDDPDHTHEASWTIQQAEAAGLTGKGAWKTYPAAMLQARATTAVIRAAASDVVLGMAYTAEELGADIVIDEATGEIVEP